MIFSKTLLAITLALSASALPSQPFAHNALHHRSIAVRHATPEPEPVHVPEPVLVKPKRKRTLNKRCLPASASSSAVLPSSSVAASSVAAPSVSAIPSSSAVTPTLVSSSFVASSSDPASSAAPINVGGAPPTFASSQAAPTSSAAPPPPPPSSSAAPPPPPPTSTYVAPTSTYVPPPPTSTYVPPPPPPSTSEVPTSTAVANPSEPTWMTGTNTGDATWYDAGLGACGITNTNEDLIVAVSWELFDNYPGYNGVNPNTNPVCNKQIQANYQGASVLVTVTDRCTGCDTTSIDFTPTAFQYMANLDVGRLYGMTWTWVD